MVQLNVFAALIAAATLSFPVVSRSDVAEVSPHGFSLQFQFALPVSSEQAFIQLLELEDWWDPDHTYSGNADNLTLELSPGGCLCEAWESGAVEHMRVVYFERGKQLRLRGGLGPLQAIPVSGAMAFTFQNHDGGSNFTFTYRVAGSVPLEDWAAPVDSVWKGHLNRFVALFDGEN